MSAWRGRAQSDNTNLLHHIVQRIEHREHTLDVPAIHTQLGRVVEPLAPLFVPQDSDADQLLAYEQRLVDEYRTMLPHALDDVRRSCLPRRAGRLGCHRQGEDERLRVIFANLGQQGMNVGADEMIWRRYSGEDLEIC